MIQLNTFVPELSHVINEGGSAPVFVTVNGRIGCIFEIPVLDLESQGADGFVPCLKRLVSALPSGTLLRVLQRTSSTSAVGFESFRSQAISEIGFIHRKILISIEKSVGDIISFGSLLLKIRRQGSTLTYAIRRLLNELPHHELLGLKARALSVSETKELFIHPCAQIMDHGNFIDAGDQTYGVLRIYKPGTRAINETTLTAIIDQLPVPFEVSVSIRRVSRRKTDFKLRSQLEKSELSNDPLADAKHEATQNALNATALFGETLCEMEWLVIMSRKDEAQLRRDLEKAKSILSSFGDVMIETAGCVPSFVAAQFGAPQHFTFLEENSVVPFYLPVFAFGENINQLRSADNFPSRTLLVHRLDGSIHYYDHFSRKFLAYNAIISGKAGSGKSVFANALSSALLQDPNILMIKIDVGGSYKKECELFGGTSVEFNLDNPSGVNPFRIFGEIKNSNEATDVLAEFISTLIREEGECQIPKSLRAQIEECLKRYVASLEINDKIIVSPNIDHFLSVIPNIPRKELLSRWASGGVFENAMNENPLTMPQSNVRYRYFNFENIQAAANRDFAEGNMAAVIAMVNLEMLHLSNLSHGQTGKRLVVFCDETKFFIERFSKFFQLTAANFRKFGHGLILMLQNIRDAELPQPDGTRDQGLILNSPIRVFFQADTEAKYLKSQFQFEDHHLAAVVTHPYRGLEYREAVLQDDTGTRVVRLYLTDLEYWQMTSTREDVDKFNNLKNAVPGLTVEETIRCLSITVGR